MKPESPSDKRSVQVPREEDVPVRPDSPPPAGSINPKDEDEAVHGKPLPGDSAIAKALHDNPPRGKGQLGVGAGGNSGRTGKEGIFGKPIPPRGDLSPDV